MLAPIAVLIATQTACLGYLSRAGYGQMEILWNRRPIPEVIADDRTPDGVRNKLRFVQRVRAFALERLNLRVADTFTTYTRLDRDAVAWNVSASERLRLKPKTWWFPIVGTVPYLGFFSRSEAEELKARLNNEGWDAIVSTVSGYSTLGWFNDPLVSPQMAYSEWHLAELVIHESSHATLWFPGDVNFNESFASFTGREGALQYYREQYGADSDAYRERLEYIKENDELSLIFHNYATMLNDTYNQNKTDDWKRREKERLIQGLQASLRRQESRFRTIQLNRYGDIEWNNAHFLMHLRYESGADFFRDRFVGCQRDWNCFLQRMQELQSQSPEERRRLLSSSRDLRPGTAGTATR